MANVKNLGILSEDAALTNRLLVETLKQECTKSKNNFVIDIKSQSGEVFSFISTPNMTKSIAYSIDLLNQESVQI
jgi:hypothetical protein